MTRTTMLCVATSLVLLGCGVDEEPPRPRAMPAEGTRLADMTLEQRIEATKEQDANAPKVFVRADGSGEGDAVADYRACRLSKLEDPAFLRANGIKQVLMLAQCMRERGWVLRDPPGGGDAS